MHEIEVEKEPMLAGDLLHKMFAKKMIQELGEEPQNSQTEKELITELSLMYNIISPFTSFICVDEGQKRGDVIGEMLVRRMESMMRGGTGGDRRQCRLSRILSDEATPPTQSARQGRCKALWNCCGCFYRCMTGEDEFSEALANSKTLRQKVWVLTSLQLASGHFREHKIIGDVVGRPLWELKAQVPHSKPKSLASWLTAIVIAFLELKCHAERDFWEMSVEKARTVVLNLEFIEKAKKLITEL